MKKTKTTQKRKSSAAKKLVPATGMLLVSALMLTTSTYAWFTMSREVEVQNIKLTATVPEDIQLSLGHLDVSTATDTSQGLANNEFYLSGSADDGAATDPATGTDKTSMLDWSNTADISHYYKLGKIMPSSSTDGKNIYFTPDSDGVGRTLKSGAKYYAAALGLAAQADSTTASGDIVANYKTKLHAVTGGSDAWTSTTATAYNITNHDGYYVDIPVWLRTSSTTAPTLAVDAYVTTNSTVDDDDLYLAARAAVLYTSTLKDAKYDVTDAETANVLSTGLIEVRDGGWSSLKSVVDFMTTTNDNGEAVSSVDGSTNSATYADGTHYDGSQKVVLAAGTGGTYGTATKVVVRVWLEGEDPNCWNANAGQNFNICLRFTKDAFTQATNAEGTAPTGANYPMRNTFAADTSNLDVGTRTTVNLTDTSDSVLASLVYEYDGTGWSLKSGVYREVGTGYKWVNASEDATTVTDASTLATYVGSKVTTNALAGTGITLKRTAVS